MQNREQLDILYKLKKEVEKSDHSAFIHTINQMIKKVYLNHYTMTFVGHFSAGKSTVINRLIGQDILPSSPVPTTSNTALVTIAEAPGITANIEGQKYTQLNSYDDVKQMNRENFHVESIDIRIQSDAFHKVLHFKIHQVSIPMYNHTICKRSNFCIRVISFSIRLIITMYNPR